MEIISNQSLICLLSCSAHYAHTYKISGSIHLAFNTNWLCLVTVWANHLYIVKKTNKIVERLIKFTLLIGFGIKRAKEDQKQAKKDEKQGKCI